MSIETKNLLSIDIDCSVKTVFLTENIYVIENNVVIQEKRNHRRPINPGDDYSNEAQEVKDICAAVHTQDVVESYRAHLAEQELLNQQNDLIQESASK